jgi:hypothetical protein
MLAFALLTAAEDVALLCPAIARLQQTAMMTLASVVMHFFIVALLYSLSVSTVYSTKRLELRNK